ncbi:glycosyltransferase [Desulforhopalus singaporensis]|uniref:Glycosyltransferase involved in cell wall bisynthesis n=1 Tax=Desulforhopalus singaporensis TaxID=91360 RepID=A0A1H0UY21_9BACT|nr:glycosyltransferase [Desulforhopalus singaporensis]SDP70955.1 Glycosyltransferase involved in cell wall bisynthesis [Desulforhopalus singaporensis]
MNVALYILTMSGGGAEKQCALLAAGLSGAGHDVRVIIDDPSMNRTSNIEILKEAQVELDVLPDVAPWRKVVYLSKYLRHHRVDALFCYLTQPDFYGGLAARLAGVRKIYGGIRNCYLPGWKLVLECVSHHLFCSKTVFNCFSGRDAYAGRLFKSLKCHVIPNCSPFFNPPVVRKGMEIIKVISVSRFVEQKDYLTALRSFRVLAQTDGQHEFIIVGHGELKEQIEDWAKELGIACRIKIHVNPPNIPELLLSADIYLSTSLFEGTSNSIMEAMNYSLPVVCTDVGDNRLLVKHGESGFVCPVKDVASLGGALRALAGDKATRDKFGCRANELLRKNHSLESFISAYENLLEN